MDVSRTRNANVESRSENCQGESVLYVNRRTTYARTATITLESC